MARFALLALAATLLLAGGLARAAPGISGLAGLRTGIASWYGPGFQGRRMANGCVFRQEDSTAASRTLPIGAWVRVRRLHSRRQTIVPITDRGPYISGRVIDLSRSAAESLDMIGPGLVVVTIEVLELRPLTGCLHER